MVGGVGLGISVIDNSIRVLSLIRDIYIDTQHYGDEVTTVRARITHEIARLHEFSEYLRLHTITGDSHISTLHPSCQSAVIRLIEELDVTFVTYTNHINKYNTDSFRKGYAKSNEGESSRDAQDSRSQEAKDLQATNRLSGRLLWSLFQKRNVLRLLKVLEDWNDRLIKLLLCSISLGMGKLSSITETNSTDATNPKMKVSPEGNSYQIYH